MGKRPEDLPLSDEPLQRLEPVDVRDTEWYQFCAEIDDMIASMDFDWALSTIEGIRDSVEKFKTVTVGQRRAIENVRNARRRSDGWRRRYEGWGRR